MRSFRRRDRGLSEIVGTLILILIVVSAATLLAAFVASYQKQLQSEQSYAHDQSLESIHILALSTVSNAAGTSFTSFSFELASEYVNPSSILGITINGDVIGPFTWTNLTTGLTGTYVVGENLELQPFDIVQVNLGLTCPGSSCSFPGAVPTPNTYLNFNVYTVLQNDFTRVFLPPVPLFVVSEINPTGGSNPDILLDGSSSFQPEGNSTLVQWAWTVTDPANPSTPVWTGTGEEAEFPASLLTGTPPYTYDVSLSLTNSVGLVDTLVLPYTTST